MVILQKIQHRETPRIGLFFGYDEQLIQSAMSIGARWSRTQRCWYVDYGKENFQKVKQVFPEIETINDPEEKVLQPVPGLQKSHDNAPIVAAQNDTALPLQVAAEYNPFTPTLPKRVLIGYKAHSTDWPATLLLTLILTKTLKSDKLM